MSRHIGVGGAWKTQAGNAVEVGDAWKTVVTRHIGVSGAWKLYYDAAVETVPAAPSISVTTPTAGQVRVTVTDNSTNEDNLYIYRSTTSGFTPSAGNRVHTAARSGAEKAATGGTVVWDDTGVTEGTTYYYKAGASNSAGEAFSLQGGATVAYVVPGVPAWHTVQDTVADDDGVDLRLVAASGSGTMTYHVYYRVGASMGGSPLSYSYLGGFTEAQIVSAVYVHATGQAHGTTIYYQARAENPGGYSGFNTESSATISVRVPGTPTIGTASETAGIATVPWAAGSPDNETLYRIEEEYRTTPGGVFGSTATFTNPANDLDATRPLVDGREYRWRVRAENAGGNSVYSAWSNAVIYTEAPGTPTVGTLSYDGTNPDSELTLSWTVPGTGTVDGYDIEIVDYAASFTGTPTHTATGAATASKRITGLADDTQKKARVRATNVWGGASVWSGSDDEWTAPSAPSAPTLTVTATADNTLALEAGIVADVDEYAFYTSVGTLLSLQVGVTYNRTGLSANTQYSQYVKAVNAASVGSPHSDVYSAASATVSKYTLVDTPQGFTAVRDTTVCPLNEFDTSWSNANGDGVSRSEAMTLERDDGAGYAVVSSTVTAGLTSYNDTAATTGTVGYRIKYNSESGYAADTSLGPPCPE